MNKLRSHFEINARFRNGIFLFAMLIFLLLLIAFFIPFSSHSISSLEELTEFQAQIDSLKKKKNEAKASYAMQPFNPNFITEYKGYVIGLSPDQLDRIYEYREQKKWINSVDDFKKVTGVSDSLLKTIVPLLKFPDWIRTSGKEKRSKRAVKTFAQKNDLNTVTAAQLQEDTGIPDFIAARIVNYRKKIGGYISDMQLKDVFGLYEGQRDKLLSLYTVKTVPEIVKINVNTASVKELVEVPYFDFETALSIKDYVEMKHGISDLKELEKIEGISLEKIDRIALYLKVK